jgi:hypothetical protein
VDPIVLAFDPLWTLIGIVAFSVAVFVMIAAASMLLMLLWYLRAKHKKAEIEKIIASRKGKHGTP